MIEAMSLRRSGGDVPRPDEPALPPSDPPPAAPGDTRSPRVKFANWMESTFGSAYLPISMGVGGAVSGGAVFFALDHLTGVRPLAIAGGAAAAAVGGLYAGVLMFSD